MNATYPFCHSILLQFNIFFSLYVHEYLSVGICIFGIMSNSLNILTLSRKSMASPINAILLSLSIIDLLLLFTYVPYALNGNVLILYELFNGSHTFTWIFYAILYTIGCSALHAISIWITVLIAVYRYMVVVYPFKNGIWNSTKRTYIAVATVCLMNLLLITPLYLSILIQPTSSNQITDNSSENANVTYYTVTMAFYDAESTMHYWFTFYNVFAYLIPSILQILLISK